MSKKTGKPMGKKAGAVVPLRVPEDMGQRVKRVAHANNLSEADIMRLAIERGISAVEKMFEKPETAAA